MAEKETGDDLRFLLLGPESGRPSSPTPEEGRRLVVAFMSIKDATARAEIIDFVERRSRIDKNPESLADLSRPGRRVRAIASSIRTRFWLEAGLAVLCGFLGILTLFTRDWIEAITGFDLDDHNGSFEWAIVAALFLLCALLSIAARAEWRRPSPAHAGI